MAVSFPQKIGNYSNSENVKFFEQQFAVCRVVLEDGRGGTGFLIGKNLIMTNNHVIPDEATAQKAKAIFFYTTGALGIEVNLDPNSFFCTSLTPDQLGFKPITAQNLDFTIVSIHSHPKIAEITHLAFCIFNSQKPEKGNHANIIHHPLDSDGTCYQKISFRDNTISEVKLHTLHYTTFTMPGSSGSPVMDDQGNLFALHRATCTEILSALLKVLNALLKELFPSAVFIEQEDSVRAIIDGSSLYIFFKGGLKGTYRHEDKMDSPASLFMLLPKPAKEWALQFLTRQGITISDHHKNCNTAVPMHAICTYLQNNSHLDFIKAQNAATQENFVLSLKEIYRQSFAFMPLILTNSAFPIESFFTQLSIVSHSFQEEKEKEVRKRDPHLVEKDSLREIYTRLCAAEKEIDLKSLFDDRDGKPIKRILLLGRAGIGKSTLCQKIAYDWASNTLFQDKFISIYHLKLRELNGWVEKNRLSSLQTPDEWLSFAIAQFCYQGSNYQQIYREIQNHPDKILPIFDGWDEASPDLVKIMERYLRETKIKHCLLTSRPGVTAKIQTNFTEGGIIVENIGFTHQHIETYVEKFFTHTKSEKVDLFLQTLRSRNNLYTIAHIPIQLQILCALWQQGIQRFPQTLTSMFSKIVGHLFGWEQERGGFKGKDLLYQALGEIGLKGLETKQLIIPKNMIDHILRKPCFRTMSTKDLITTGLIKACDSGEIYFIHLTYQEYSIAQYVSSLSEHEQCIFVQNYRYKPQFHLVIRMLAGCLWEGSNGSIEQLEKFFTSLYSGHVDMIGAYQAELVLSCLDECQSEKLEEVIWQRYKIADFVENVSKNERRWNCLGQLMAVSEKAFSQVLKTLQQNKQQTVWFFNNLKQFVRREYLSTDKETLPTILSSLQTALGDENKWVRRAAVEALENIAAQVSQETLPTTLSLLQTALGDKEERVRTAAAGALGNIAAQVSQETFPTTLSLLQTALGDKEGRVRTAAAGALGEIAAQVGQEALPTISSSLQTALGDKEGWVRQAAAKAFGNIAAQVSQETLPTILSLLQTAFGDKDWQVQQATAEALGKIAAQVSKETLPTILSWLQTALGDKEGWMRYAAAGALGEIAAQVSQETFPTILSLLQTALGDKEGLVRTAAAEALGKIAAQVSKETLPTILSWLQTALGDEDSDMRTAAVEALGNITAHVSKETLPTILSLLQTALGDEDERVRRAAAEALGKIAAHVSKETLPTILSWLQTALGDEDLWVRQAAAKALGKIAAQVSQETLPTILSWLQTALGDEDLWVRKAAAEALGKIAAQVSQETLPTILSSLQTALGDEDQLVRYAAARAIDNLDAKLFVPVFISSSKTYSAFKPLIFDCFINQLVPLYCTETNTSCFIQTSDTNLCPFNITQKTVITRLCTELMHPSMQKPPENCVVQ